MKNETRNERAVPARYRLLDTPPMGTASMVEKHLSAWDAMSPHDVTRFGEVILDPQERRRWSAAILIGGLPYIWSTFASDSRQQFVERLDLRPGNRVLLIGEGLAGIGIDAEINDAVGSSGEVVVVDFLEEVRQMVEEGRFPQWRWGYFDDHRDASFDAIAVFQGVAHSSDWRSTAQDLARVLIPGGRVALGEVVFGPPMAAVIRQDAHVHYVFTKMWEVLFPGQEFEEQPYWGPHALKAAFDGVLEDTGSAQSRGVELFWGRRR